MADSYDKQALKILLDTYWTPEGWRGDRTIRASDREYAIRHGVMFEPAQLDHDKTLSRVSEMCASITPAAVGSSFLASMSARQPYLRSAMGSYSVGRVRPSHAFEPNARGIYCKHCSLPLHPDASTAEDLDVLSFERIKWGGVRHSQAAYQWFDLQQFLERQPPTPTSEDVALFRDTLKIVATLPPDATAGAYAKAIRTTFPSNLSERRKFIEVLSLTGIFAYPGYGDVFDSTQPPSDRPYRDSDWGIPAMYWRARDGVNAERLREYFPSHVDQLISA